MNGLSVWELKSLAAKADMDSLMYTAMAFEIEGKNDLARSYREMQESARQCGEIYHTLATGSTP